MAIPLRARTYGLGVALIVVAAVSIVGMTSYWLYGDKSSLLQEMTVRVSSVSGRAFQERIKGLAAELRAQVDTSSDRRMALQKMVVGSKLQDQSPFVGIAALQKDGAGAWTLSSFDKKSSAQFAEYISEFQNKLEAGLRAGDVAWLGFNKLQPNDVRVVALPKSKGHQLLAVVAWAGAQRGVVGLVTENRLQELVREFKSAYVNVFFVEDGGTIIAHPQDNLVGVRLTKNAVVQSILQSSRKFYTGEIIDEPETSVYASYEAVGGTNVYAVATVPLLASHRLEKKIVLSILGVLGVALLGLAMIFKSIFETHDRSLRLLADLSTPESMIIHRDWIEEFSKNKAWADLSAQLQNVPVMPQAVTPVIPRAETLPPVVVEDKSLLNEGLLQATRLAAVEEAGKELTREMKTPVSAILGHLQLAKKKTESPELQKHLEFVDRETRSLRDMIDQVARVGFYRTLHLASQDTLEIVSDAVSDAQYASEIHNVVIRKNLFPVPRIRVSQKEFAAALKDLIVDRARKVSTNDDRDILVHVEPFEDRVLIRIEDSGTGLSDAELRELQDPLAAVGRVHAQTDLKALQMAAVLVTHSGQLSSRSDLKEGRHFLELSLPGDFSKSVVASDTSSVAVDAMMRESAYLDPEINFVAEPVETQNQSRATETHVAVAPVDLPLPPPVPGSLAEFSVKVRKPRLNV